MSETTSTIKEHINNHHPDGFESLNHITLDSNIDCSRYELLKCKECNKLFYYEADIETHTTRVHEFGEYWNPYPCEECGFNGSNVIENKEHQQNHKYLGTQKPNGTDKSYGIIIISDDNIEVYGDSAKDEDWTTSKEDKNLLRKDSEDEFMFNCNQCEFDTVFEHQLKYHIEWQH